MKRLTVLAILVLNGQLYWTPCDQGGVFCPHFNTAEFTVEVSSNTNVNTIRVAYEPAPTTIVRGLEE